MRDATVMMTVAAVGGLVLAMIGFATRKFAPKWLPLWHGGLLAAAALLVLLLQEPLPSTVPLTVLATLVLAAFGPFLLIGIFSLAAAATGVTVYRCRARGEALPAPLLLVHAATALGSLASLALWL